MEFVAHLIDIFKTNTEVFCKETTEKLTNYWTGSSYIMLRIKTMVPRARLLIAICHKYNSQKFIFFIFTDNKVITQAGLTYLSKYPDQFYNVSILSDSFPLVVYNFFGPVNEVDSHNKSMQYYMEPEEFWVTQYCRISLCTTVDMKILLLICLNYFVMGFRENAMKQLLV